MSFPRFSSAMRAQIRARSRATAARRGCATTGRMMRDRILDRPHRTGAGDALTKVSDGFKGG